jgi:hypothetical protein
MMKRSIFTSALLGVGAAVLTAVPANAGVLDGALNNLHVLDHVSALSSNLNSDPQAGENNNSNTRADGRLNNSVGQHQ